MATTIRWYGDALETRLREAAGQAVKRAAQLVVTRARLLANRPATRIRRKRTRATVAGPKGSQYTVFVGSRPGQPPMVRTAFGRRNITAQYYPDALVARIGVDVNADYMAYLEVGTERIAPRPWLRPALEQSLPSITTILQAGLREAVR